MRWTLDEDADLYDRARPGYPPRLFDDLAVLGTGSGRRAPGPAARDGLLDCVGRLIDNHHGGRVTSRYLTELRLARHMA